MPRIDAAMNKIGPTASRGGKGSKDDDKNLRLGLDRDDDKTQKILLRAKKRMDRCIQAESENRKNGLDDLRFKTGEGQWPADVAAQRNFDKRPCLTINKLPTFINQIVNDFRQNRPAINYSPMGDKGHVEVAKFYKGYVRAIERDSFADIAYDTGFESAVSIGWGYWRPVTEYKSPESFDQVIRVRRVRNAFSIYLDDKIQEPDGSDAKFGFVTEDWTRQDFEDQWPDADPMAWSTFGIGDTYKSWVSQDTIRVAEYFEIEHEERTLVQLSNGHTGWKDELAEEIKSLIDAGIYTIENERKSKVPHVKWYKMTAVDILEERDWPGKWVPLPKVVGNEVDIEGKVRLSGIIRSAKSPQLMYNYMRTLAVEVISGQPKAPWVVAEGQIAGHEVSWKTAHTRNHAYLQYRPVALGGTPVPPPQRQPLPGPTQGIVQESQQAAQDMQAVTGLRFDGTLQERVYDESGRALRELRERGDIGSFHYIDNHARTLRFTGEIYMDLIQKIHDTPQLVTILGDDDQEERVMIDPDQPVAFRRIRGQDGRQIKSFNPKIGEYQVTVTIGPSYATKRIEAAESIMDFVRALPPAIAPQVMPLIMDVLAKNLDWPGGDEIARRLATLVPPEALAQDMQDMPPQAKAMVQSLQKQLQQMGQERVLLMQQLTDQNAERAIKQDKIDKDFEAKLLAIVQKAEASFTKEIGAELKGLAEGVNQLREILTNPDGEVTDGQ